MHPVDVAIIGTGSVGIAVAYYLVRDHDVRRVALIDPLPPMSLTSAQSGENYRNWWPHRVMTAFFGAELLSCDAHFAGLPNLAVLLKKA